MLMPTGPPALMLSALADVAGAGEEEKLSIAKFLTVSLSCNVDLPVLMCTDRIRHLAIDLPIRSRELEGL